MQCIIFKCTFQHVFIFLKGTVHEIKSDPLCQGDNVRFTTESLKPLSFAWLISGIFFVSLFHKTRNEQVTFTKKTQIKMNNLKKQKYEILIHTWSEKGYLCKSGKAIFALRTPCNYAYGPFESAKDVSKGYKQWHFFGRSGIPVVPNFP